MRLMSDVCGNPVFDITVVAGPSHFASQDAEDDNPQLLLHDELSRP
jgi:hypothetical protein